MLRTLGFFPTMAIQYHLQGVEIPLLADWPSDCCIAPQISLLWSSIKMPQTGERNTLFGVFASACCGAEIVIATVTVFPACPNHPQVITTWEPIEVGPDNFILLPKKKAESAA